MKSLISLVGIVLIIFGIGVLGYKGFTYKTQEKVAQIGDLQVTTQNENHVYFPPVIGGASIVIGIVLIAIMRIRK
jgi:hypothetical protein